MPKKKKTKKKNSNVLTDQIIQTFVVHFSIILWVNDSQLVPGAMTRPVQSKRNLQAHLDDSSYYSPHAFCLQKKTILTSELFIT